MPRVSTEYGLPATITDGTNAVSCQTDDKSDADWFSDACRTLYDAKAGTALHYETGFDERSCQRYAAGHVKPPAYFLRTLLRGENGHVWLAVVMDKSEALWWARYLRAQRIYEHLKAELKD